MSPDTRRIAKGEWILVTGANGYIASHIVDILLEEGYSVRGTVRSEKPWLNKLFDDKYGPGRFETVIVSDLADEVGFEKALPGIAGVFVTATDMSANQDANVVVPAVVAYTVNCLKAAARYPIKSFVLTSSSTATTIPVPGKEMVVDEDTWNTFALEAAFNPDTPKGLVLSYLVYAASKTAGEQALWKWVKEENPSFAVNAVLPNMNLGAILAPEIPGSTMAMVRILLNGDDTYLKVIPPQYFVDVRDDARLHVATLLDPTVQRERIFAYAKEYNWTDLVGLLRKHRPNNTKIPDPPENEGRDVSDVKKPSQRAEKLLQSFFGMAGWTSLEDSLVAGIADL